MALCTQCGTRPPIWRLENHLLCLDCYSKLMQAQAIQFEQNARLINFCVDHMESVVGLPGLSPRIAMPKPIVHTGDMTLNNIDVRDSVLGAINTGEVERLDVALSNVRVGGNRKLAVTLKQLTQSILDAEDITDDQRTEMLEAMSYVAQQAVLPAAERQKSLGRRVVATLAKLLNASGSLASIAQVALPHIHKIFS